MENSSDQVKSNAIDNEDESTLSGADLSTKATFYQKFLQRIKFSAPINPEKEGDDSKSSRKDSFSGVRSSRSRSSSDGRLRNLLSTEIRKLIFNKAIAGVDEEEVQLLKKVILHFFTHLAGSEYDLRSLIMNQIFSESKGYICAAFYNNKSVILEVVGHQFFEKHFSINHTEDMLGEELESCLFRNLVASDKKGSIHKRYVNAFLQEKRAIRSEFNSDAGGLLEGAFKVKLIGVDHVYFPPKEVSFVFAELISIHKMREISDKIHATTELLIVNTRMMNHQVKNVAQQMNYLVGELLETLEGESGNHLTGKSAELMQSIFLALLFAGDVVEQAFTPERLLAEESISPPSKFDLRLLLKSIATIFNIEAKFRFNKSVILQQNEEIPAWVFGQAIEIKNVMHVLLSNALRFAKILVKIDFYSHDDHYYLLVEDDGQGMDPNEWLNIQQMDNESLQKKAAESKDKNWGSGLHDAYIACAKLGWDLHLQPCTDNGGACFKLTFNVVPDDGIDNEIEIKNKKFPHQAIVILDDQISSLVFLTRLLIGQKLIIINQLTEMITSTDIDDIPEDIKLISIATRIPKLKQYLERHDYIRLTVEQSLRTTPINAWGNDADDNQQIGNFTPISEVDSSSSCEKLGKIAEIDDKSWDFVENGDVYLVRSPHQYWVAIEKLIEKGISPLIFLDNILEYDNASHVSGINLIKPTLEKFLNKKLPQPVLFMQTGDASEIFNANAVELGAREVLAKPISRAKLAQLAHSTQKEHVRKTSCTGLLERMMSDFAPEEIQKERLSVNLQSSEWNEAHLSKMEFPRWFHQKADAWIAVLRESQIDKRRSIVSAAGQLFCHFPVLCGEVILPLPSDFLSKYEYFSELMNVIENLDWRQSYHKGRHQLASSYASLTLMPIDIASQQYCYAMLLVDNHTEYHNACDNLEKNLSKYQELSQYATGRLRNWINGLWSTIPHRFLPLSEDPSSLSESISNIEIDIASVRSQMQESLNEIRALKTTPIKLHPRLHHSPSLFSMKSMRTIHDSSNSLLSHDSDFLDDFLATLTLVTVEDSRMQQLLYKKNFNRFSCHTTFSCMDEFFAYCKVEEEAGKNFQPDIIMLDNNGIDEKKLGYEFVDELSEKHPRAVLVLCSGESQEEFTASLPSCVKYDFFIEKNAKMFDLMNSLLSPEGAMYKMLQKPKKEASDKHVHNLCHAGFS